jgi:type II secretory pathway component GspD/PulD (secretin)
MSQDIRAVLRDLAAQAGVNIAIEDSIQNRITIRLNEVPFEDALRILSSSAGFKVKEDTGVFLVHSLASDASYPAQGVWPGAPHEAPSSFVLETGSIGPESLCNVIRTLGTSLVPTPFPDLGIVVVTGAYSEVNSARAALTPWLSAISQSTDGQAMEVVRVDHLDPQEALSSFFVQFPGVRITPIRDSSFVVVSGKPADVERTVAAIESIDIPPRVVGIEVEVVEVVQDDLSRLGVGWKGPLGEPGLTVSWEEAEPRSTPGSGGGSLGQIELRPWIRSSLSLIMDINLLIERGKAKVLARPSVATLENKQATIMTGDRYILVLNQGQGHRPGSRYST